MVNGTPANAVIAHHHHDNNQNGPWEDKGKARCAGYKKLPTIPIENLNMPPLTNECLTFSLKFACIYRFPAHRWRSYLWAAPRRPHSLAMNKAHIVRTRFRSYILSSQHQTRKDPVFLETRFISNNSQGCDILGEMVLMENQWWSLYWLWLSWGALTATRWHTLWQIRPLVLLKSSLALCRKSIFMTVY